MDRKGFLGALAGLLVAPKILAKKEPEAVISGFPPLPTVRSGYAHIYEDSWPIPEVRWANAVPPYVRGDIVQQSAHTMTVYL